MKPSHRFLPVLILVIGLGLIVGFASDAAELTVPGGYGSIQAAVNAANSGDTVLIAEGTYDEVVQVEKSGITFEAAGEVSATVLNGTINIESAYGTVVDGLTITGAGDGIRVRGNTRGPEPSLVVRNSVISGNTGDGIDLSHGASYVGVSIENNQINGNGADGVKLQGIGDDVVLAENTVSDNGAIESTGVGVRVGGGAKGVVIENNTMEDNSFANIHPGG